MEESRGTSKPGSGIESSKFEVAKVTQASSGCGLDDHDGALLDLTKEKDELSEESRELQILLLSQNVTQRKL